jgi:DNA-binding response OmpR family regulator
MPLTSAPAQTILLIEDDRDISAAVVEVLADEGFDTITVPNGLEGLEKLRSPGPRPFLIVLDLMLPVMDAWEFRSAQASDATIADIPVAIFSANPKISKHADELRAAAIIRKPPNLDELLDTVMRFAAGGSAVA